MDCMTFLALPDTLSSVDGDEIRQQREVLGWTQPQLAQKLGVGARTVGNWERGETVPRNRLGMLRKLFAETAGEDGSGDPLSAFSDAALLHELLRRALARE